MSAATSTAVDVAADTVGAMTGSALIIESRGRGSPCLTTRGDVRAARDGSMPERRPGSMPEPSPGLDAGAVAGEG